LGVFLTGGLVLCLVVFGGVLKFISIPPTLFSLLIKQGFKKLFVYISEKNILQAIVAGREAKVKRRKCRTAFTTFQLSVLEQRFNCHKYLTPTDRDQIANILGLSPPQVK